MEEVVKKSRKRLILNINEELHAEIKVRSGNRYMTITGYVLQALIEKIMREDQSQ